MNATTNWDTNLPTIEAEGKYGLYSADPARVSTLAAQYFGNVNSSYRVLRAITVARLGHDLATDPTEIEMLVMLASNDGQSMSDSELRDALASDEFAGN